MSTTRAAVTSNVKLCVSIRKRRKDRGGKGRAEIGEGTRPAVMAVPVAWAGLRLTMQRMQCIMFGLGHTPSGRLLWHWMLG